MAGKRERSDSRLNVARYRVDGTTPGEAEPDETDTAGQSTMEARAHFVELQVQQAIRRGDFDNLPGAGKPLAGLHPTHDPDWWIRQKIQREQITGLGPPALTLRTEHAALDGRLDAVGAEPEVREILADFNRRVVEARRQLQGGPPVVTPTRDVEEEVARWRERRAARVRAVEAARQEAEDARASLTRRERRRADRAARGR